MCQPKFKRGKGRPQKTRFKNFMEKQGMPFSGSKKGKKQM
jgi:hypothetical protein